MNASQTPAITWKDAPTRTITADGVQFAYRELGADNPGAPVVFLIHLAAVLDNWDPRVVDGFAKKHRVIAFDTRGVGASSGTPATSMEEMARDAIAFIKAMGLHQVARVTYFDMLRGWLTFQDPKQFLFFTRTPAGIQAGKEFLQRLKERTQDRDKEITVAALQAQLKALRRWGEKKPADLSKVHHPVLVANGDSDRMVPSKNTLDLARRLPNSELVIYPDSGHGAVFQFHADFVPKALQFLAR